MKKLAVLFSGIGYSLERPLLYYAKKLAEEMEYEVISIGFKDLPEKKEGADNAKWLKEVIEAADKQTKKALKGVKFGDYEDIIFISKSVGTVAAAKFAYENELETRQVFFTPLDQAFDYHRTEKGVAYVGTSDPWAPMDEIRVRCRKNKYTMRIIDDGNHSLETGKVVTDLDNFAGVMRELSVVMGGVI